jgi:hypothetical protein
VAELETPLRLIMFELLMRLGEEKLRLDRLLPMLRMLIPLLMLREPVLPMLCDMWPPDMPPPLPAFAAAGKVQANPSATLVMTSLLIAFFIVPPAFSSF